MEINLSNLERDVTISLLENALNGWEGDFSRQEAARSVLNKLRYKMSIFCVCPTRSKHPGRTSCLICLKFYPTASGNPPCPECGEDLRTVEYPANCPLNRDQWESQLAGNLYCTCHNNHTANKPYAYFWRSQFETRNA